MDREAGFQERDWPRIRDAQERMQRTMDATADRALLALGAGPCRRPAGRTADRRGGPGCRPEARNGQGRRGSGDRRVSAAAVRGHEAGRSRFPPQPDGEEHRGPAGDQGPVYSARGGDGAAGGSQSRSGEESRRSAGAPDAALYGSLAGEGGRPGRSGRQQHSARDLWPGEGGGREGRSLLQAADHAGRHSREAHRRGGFRRAQSSARRHQGAAVGQEDAVSSMLRWGTFRSTSCRPWTRREEIPDPRR